MSLSPVPAIKVPTICQKCLALHPLSEYLQERSLPDPFGDVIEGVLECPSCGIVTHSYYMTKTIRNRQAEIRYKIRILGQEHTSENFEKIKILRFEYNKIFDECQKFYADIMEKVATQDGRGS